MLSSGCSAVLTAMTLSLAVRAADLQNMFLYPELGAVFSNGDAIQAKWQSNFTNPTLTMWCVAPGDDDILMKYQSSADVPSFNGTKAVTLDLKNIEGCWFMLSAEKEKSFNSIKWKLANNGLPVTSSTAGATTTTSTSTGTVAGGNTTPTSIPTSMSTPAPGNGQESPAPLATTDGADMSTAAKAGIGAGIAVAALLAIAGLAMFLLGRRKMKAANEITHQYEQLHQGQPRQQTHGQNSSAPSMSHDGSTLYAGQTAGVGPYEAVSSHITGKDVVLEMTSSPAPAYGQVSPLQEQEREQHSWPELASREAPTAELHPVHLYEMPDHNVAGKR
ncbi:uncharacterized protein B0I36DRAFT_31579 [Microdochium trichocladiopsis]|uniref:Mid2 domain-containing protein n=1 Tax=Microdochium trichocladiopsis TaxID=1682393 RepID=A0A9P9BKL1_9PEZI|nr:uncharacterized protein B0I36DRAFT_31579 [Microdochium trichocladiopsis]KAH7021359.1 hypothetical protein B0I36DRAFT_31579 [Microdochium trichocladiopsis]